MSVLDKAVETQLGNIEKKTGQERSALCKTILAQGLTKHGEMVKWTQSELGLGYGDANALVHLARRSAEPAETNSSADPLDSIYAGSKAHLRLIHDKLMKGVADFGPFEIAPKKSYVSLRRKKQFAMLGPKTNKRFELGINFKDVISHPLVRAMPPGGMCQYVATLETPDQVDGQLIGLLRRAYDAAE